MFVALRPVAGVHVNVPGLDVPICTVSPRQIVRSGPPFALGNRFTVTVTWSLFTQLLEPVVVSV